MNVKQYAPHALTLYTGGGWDNPVVEPNDPNIRLKWLFFNSIIPSIADNKDATFSRSGGNDWYTPVGSNVLTQTGVDTIAYESDGFRIQPLRTNILLYSQMFDHAAWVKSNMTVSPDSILAPDGATAMDTLTATAPNATILQSLVSASANRVQSFYLLRKTGTGNIDVTVDGGATWSAVPVTSVRTRLTIAQTSVTDPVVGIRIVTSGDEVYVWQGDCETGKARTSIIPTTTTPTTRAADDLRLPVADGVNFQQGEGTLTCDWTPGFSDIDLPVSQFIKGIISVNNSGGSLLYYETTGGGVGKLQTTDGTSTSNLIDGYTANTLYCATVGWKTGGELILGYNGNFDLIPASYDGAFTLGTHYRIGFGATERFWIKNIQVTKTGI